MACDIVAYLARRRLEGRVAEARGRGDSIARKHNRHGLLKIIGSGLPDANLGDFSSVKIADAVPINNFLPKLKKRNRFSRELLRPLATRAIATRNCNQRSQPPFPRASATMVRARSVGPPD